MQIKFEPKALEYILSKVADKTITLEATEKPGGEEHKLSITVYPSVVKGRSRDCEQNSQNYNEIIVDGVQVYYRTKLADKFKAVTVKTEKILFITMLVAESEKC